MKLGVFKAVGTTYVFGLRHFPAFYLLCLLADLPSILYGFLSGHNGVVQFAAAKGWESDLLAAVEFVPTAFVTAVMVWALIRDRQGESWTVVAALRDAFERTPTILGVGVTFAVGIALLSVFHGVLTEIHPAAAIGLSIGMMFLWLYFAVALPCAAVDNDGVMDCFTRSFALTQGSRLRILLVYILICVPMGIAIGIFFFIVLPGPEHLEHLPLSWLSFSAPALSLFFLTAQVAIHEQLAELGEGIEFSNTAAVFD